jgi:hypothetical protein
VLSWSRPTITVKTKRAVIVPLLASVVLVSLAGCGPSPEEGRAATQSPPTPRSFNVYGLPGPWWRLGAAPAQFERESRQCRRRSSAARGEADGVDPHDAAYRAFLDCMADARWTRGLPPERPRPQPGPT